MIEPATFVHELRDRGVTHFCGVPDSLLKDLCAYIADQAAPGNHVITANEGSAIGLAAGYHLGTGRTPAVYLQNSGFGNALNPLVSLADADVYAIPMLLIIGWRGEPGTRDEPQHLTQGRIQERLLEVLAIPYRIVGPDSVDLGEVLDDLLLRMSSDPRPRALLVRSGTFAPYSPAAAPADLPMVRGEAIAAVLDRLGPHDLVVSTTGMASREVFAHRERSESGHERDFLTVGSMGHCSQVALGLARSRPNRTVYCLDGDGAMLMHLGGLATIGAESPPNLRHVVINNAAHDSVGGQPTAAGSVDLAGVAAACSYRAVATAATAAELDRMFDRLAASPGPTLLEVRVRSHARTDAGRPTTSPLDNKRALMEGLQRNDPL